MSDDSSKGKLVNPSLIQSSARITRAAKIPAIIVLSMTLLGCSPQVTMLLGSRQVNGDNSTVAATLTISQKVGKRGTCQYSHTSDPTAGQPFNEDYDLSHDFIGCGVTFGPWRAD